MDKHVIRTEDAPAPFQGAPYNQAIRTGDLVFVAGQLGLAPGGGLVEGGIAEQTEQVMRNLAAILHRILLRRPAEPESPIMAPPARWAAVHGFIAGRADPAA